DAPVSPMFAGYPGLFSRLRLEQLKNLARAYELDIDFDATKLEILPVFVAAENRGVFEQSPKNLYYFERAKWNSDQIREARDKGRKDILPLAKWHGPLPESEMTPAARKAAKAAKTDDGMTDLRAEAKALGIKSFGVGKDALARLV